MARKSGIPMGIEDLEYNTRTFSKFALPFWILDLWRPCLHRPEGATMPMPENNNPKVTPYMLNLVFLISSGIFPCEHVMLYA